MGKSAGENEIFALYRELDLWSNPTCRDCRDSVDALVGPIAVWQVGRHFHEDDYRVLFAGKTARGEPCGEAVGDYVDGTSWSDEVIANRNLAGAGRWAYWAYTRAIIESVYGSLEDGWESVAFTNLVKCNASRGIDLSPFVLKRNCLDTMRVFRQEIETIKPKAVVIYSGTSYDDFLGHGLFDKWVDVGSSRQSRLPCGQKQMPWWEGLGTLSYGDGIRVLRVGHPERMKKADFVRLVSNWICFRR